MIKQFRGILVKKMCEGIRSGWALRSSTLDGEPVFIGDTKIDPILNIIGIDGCGCIVNFSPRVMYGIPLFFSI